MWWYNFNESENGIPGYTPGQLRWCAECQGDVDAKGPRPRDKAGHAINGRRGPGSAGHSQPDPAGICLTAQGSVRGQDGSPGIVNLTVRGPLYN